MMRGRAEGAGGPESIDADGLAPGAAAAAEDAAARQRILTSLDESLVVEAAAGTGKTTVLVGRLVRLLASGRSTVERVVAVTFTRKAAGELKLRLREELNRRHDEAAAESAERGRLQKAIAHLEEARIGTIHSFCAELLRERPVEAGIDPAFRELDEEEAAALFRQVFDRWMEGALDSDSAALRRILSRLSLEREAKQPPLARLADAAWQVAAWRDHPAPWRREAWDREGDIAALVEGLAALATAAAQGPQQDPLRRSLGYVVEEAQWIERATAATPGAGDRDALEARLIALLRQSNRWENQKVGRGSRYGALDRAGVVGQRDAFLTRLEGFARRANADLAAALRDLLAGCLAAYEERKRREGRLDFLDLLLLARHLLRDQAAVRGEFQQRFSHLFVDEIQDTDPLQAEVLLLLAADDPAETDWRRTRPRPGSLFLVGDPKQSIYRFRRADVTLYEEICQRLEAHGVARLALSTSYRSVRGIQNVINAAFAPVMNGVREHGQPLYIPLAGHRPDPAGQPAVIALPVPRPLGRAGKVTQGAIDKSLPGAVAAFLQWLLADSGWTVEELGRRVPVAPRHVAVLFRRFAGWGGDVSRPYLRELEARNLPHVLLGGRTFHDREEVETLRTALRAIEHPDDELAVFATLHGSFFALGDDLLLQWRHQVGGFHPFFRPRSGELPADLAPPAPLAPLAPVAAALATLARLHRRRNRVPVGETVHELLRATHALAGFALRPAGRQVVANVQHVIELARAFEARGGLSFRRFVEQLEEQAVAGEGRQAPVMEEGEEGIRILSVHTAKGLEFPVVVLADISCPLAKKEPGRVVDSGRGLWAEPLAGCAPWEVHDHADRESARDTAEGQRLAYVAATRARDLLVVPVTGVEERQGSWIADLFRAVYPARERSQAPAAALGCPGHGAPTVLGLADDQPGGAPASILAGLHLGREGGHPVAWFDPAALAFDAAQDFGVRQLHLLAEPPDAAVVAADLERHALWQRDLETARQRGSTATWRTAIVTDLSKGSGPPVSLAAPGLPGSAGSALRWDLSGPADPPEGVEIGEELMAAVAGRPAGRRFGALVHDVLRDVPLALVPGVAGTPGDAAGHAALARLASLARRHGRRLGAPAEEIAAAAEAVAAALAHPLLRAAAAAAGTAWRELPFCLRLDDGSLVEGVLDLLFRRDDGWVVVDFKTDLAEIGRDGGNAEPARQAYRRQLAWYVWSVQQMTGEPARGWLLGV